jgi:hypothetical protein
MYVLNGYDSISTNYFGDIIKISLDKLSEDQLTYEIIKCGGSKPIPRGNSSCCIVGSLIFMFGGGSVDEAYGDLWSWDIESRSWTELPKNEETIAWPDVADD